MKRLCFSVLVMLLASAGYAQQGFSFGIQSNNGVGRLTIEEAPANNSVAARPGFATGGSLFLQWNFTEKLGIRLQADGMFQSLGIEMRENGGQFGRFGVTSLRTESFGQGAGNLQFRVNHPLNEKKTLRLEAYIGAGARATTNGLVSCGGGSFSAFDTGDSLLTVNFSSSRNIGNGIQPELLAGLQLIQVIDPTSKRPVWLTFGVGFRRTLSPISTIEGVAFIEEVVVIDPQTDPFRQFGFTPCDADFSANPEEHFVMQHFGQQAEIQVGLRFGL